MSRDDHKAPWHYLKDNRGLGCPANLFFVDTETLPISEPGQPTVEHHKFRLACTTALRLERMKETRKATNFFGSTDAVWKWLYSRTDPRRPLWVFAHNLGYDFTILGGWLEIEEGRQRLADDLWPIRKIVKTEKGQMKPWRGMLITDDPPTIISTRHDDRTIVYVDTLNYFRCSLAALGAALGCPKLPMPPFDAPDADWMEYCRNDVEIVHQAVVQLLQWWKLSKLGHFRYTAAGLSWNAYRHKFMPCNILIHKDPAALRLEREAMYGGECRCFYVGIVEPVADVLRNQSNQDNGYHEARTWGPIEVYDVRSLYPYVMREGLFPRRLHERGEGKPPYLESAVEDNIGYIACVRIKTVDEPFPIRHEGKVKYATGQFLTTLAWPELLYAHENDLITEWVEWNSYELCNLFKDFVNFFDHWRQEYERLGSGPHAQFCKLVLNSLHGKFGQKEGKWETDMTEPCIKHWGRWFKVDQEHSQPQLWRSVGWYTQKLTTRGEGAHSVPAIPAFVTAYARRHMAGLREIAGEWNVYYQDTDSLHVSPEGGKRLSDAGRVKDLELGKLRLIKNVPSAEYFGLKHYRIGDELICAGRSISAVSLQDSVYQQLEFQRLDSSIDKGGKPEVRVSKVIHKVSLCHPGGNVLPSGRVEPVRLQE